MEEGLLGVESLSDLERTAKDAAKRLMNQYGIEDFSDLQQGLRQGALKVGDVARLTMLGLRANGAFVGPP